MTIAFRLFDPSPCDFPPPKLPLLPNLAFSPKETATETATEFSFRLVGSGRDCRHYTRGRYALLDAYRISGVGPEGALLAPAYHCRTMLDPAVRLGAEIGLYALDAELAPDLASIEELCTRSATPVKALLLTHYFGFPQDAQAIRTVCEEHGIALIEDCSHACITGSDERIGSHGSLIVTSPYKFFPSPDGGLLIAGPGENLPQLPNRPQGFVNEARGLINVVTRARRLPLGEREMLRIADEIRSLKNRLPVTAVESIDGDGGLSSMYNQDEEGRASLAVSRTIIALCSIDGLVHRRRSNYMQWVEATSNLPFCRPLIPSLHSDCVPYMFPLLIERPDEHFYLLKQLGIPIWRWDEMAISDCQTATRYRRNLLHLPCHQSLQPADMRWMTAAIAAVMRDHNVEY